MSHQTLQHLLRVAAFAALLPKPLPEHSQSKVFPELENSQQPRNFEHRLLLFLLTERGLNEDFLPSFCEHCEILAHHRLLRRLGTRPCDARARARAPPRRNV